MPASTALVATAHGSRYLQQLCKHWGHRFAVSFDPAQGVIDFGSGEGLALAADAAALRLTVRAEDPEALPGLERVVTDHLLRFAFREELGLNWLRD